MHLFPASNSTQGFYSFFEHLLSQEEANHIFCVKGGPGVGKSTLMNKIASEIANLNYEIEYYHCSSDPSSLDAIVIPKLKVALLDGTSPHVVDPRNPGAVDEIINLGNFNEKELRKNKKAIIDVNNETSRLFNKAYSYLKSSKIVYDTYALTSKKIININAYYTLIKETIKEIFNDKETGSNIGKERHFFGYGITPKGIVDYRNTYIKNYKKRIIINETVLGLSEQLMNTIKDEATKRGYDILCLHSPIKVDKIEDILIKDLNIAISVNNNYHKYTFEHNKMVNMDNVTNLSMYNDIQDELDKDLRNFNTLLDMGIEYLKRAKEKHDELEKYYRNNIDFQMFDKIYQEVLNKILSYK